MLHLRHTDDACEVHLLPYKTPEHPVYNHLFRDLLKYLCERSP